MPDIVTVVSPVGEIGSIPADQLSAAEDEGYRVATPKDVRREVLFQKYGNSVENQVKAFGQGVAKSVPFVGGYALKELGVTKEAAEARSEFYPGTELLGEATGVGAQLTVPISPLKGLGAAAEGVAGMAGSAAVKKIAGSAIEGAAYNVGSEINDAVLGDKELSAEQALAAAGSGAALGALSGGLFVATEKASKKLVEAATKKASMDAPGLLDRAMKEGVDYAATAATAGLPIPGAAKRALVNKAISYVDNIQVFDKIREMAEKTAAKVERYAGDVFKPIPYAITKLDDDFIEESKDAKRRKYDEITDHVKSIGLNPEKFLNSLDEKTDHLYEYSPDMAGATQAAMVRAVSFLMGKVPQAPDNGALGAPWTPSDSQVTDFLKIYNAIENPTSILKEVANGTLTKKTLEAVSTVHPNLFAEMQRELIDKLTDKKGPIPHRTKTMIGMFLGQPLTFAQTPAATLAAQKAYAMPTQAPSQQSKPAPQAKNLGNARRSLTDTQSAALRKGM